MDLSTITNQHDPHSKRIMVDKAEWHARLERFAEMRARLDEDAAPSRPSRFRCLNAASEIGTTFKEKLQAKEVTSALPMQ